MTELPPRIALLAGATGLVGGHLLQGLLESPDLARVYAVTRRPLGREHPRLANRIVQFDRLESQLRGTACTEAFCCLGTTIAEAGSQEAFRKVDLEYVVAFARAAKAAQAQRFVVLSSVGAAPGSKNFYLRVKGEMEEAVSAVGFGGLDILQPSLLLGWRRQMRPLELAGRLLMPLINPFLVGAREPWRGISARAVARAMLSAARANRRGTYRYTHAAMQAMAAQRSARSVPPTESKRDAPARGS
jgi:uncharacterized protein YbjT (DUF2867 family)